MKCDKCGRNNRDIARYCKWCGEKLAARSRPAADMQGGPLSRLYDKKTIVEQLEEVMRKTKKRADWCRKSGVKGRLPLSFVITGNPGTGKKSVARAIAAALADMGILNSPEPEIIKPVEYKGWIEALQKDEITPERHMIVVDEAHRLCPTEKVSQIVELDGVLRYVADWRSDEDMPVVVIIGDDDLKRFFEANPEAKNPISYFLETNDITVQGMVSIACDILEREHRTLSQEAKEKLERIFVNDQRNPEAALGINGHNARRRAENISTAALDLPIDADEIGPEYVHGTEFIRKSLDEIMAEFDKYVGVEDIKSKIRTITRNIQQDVKDGRKPKINDHFIFLGNPGTGKTTMARIFGEALNALGALPVGQFVEIGADNLISQFVGDTAKQVEKWVSKAMGGILFIDEAYQLVNNDHGKDAMDALIRYTENERGKLVMILAGYEKDMAGLNKLNDGFQSRFNEIIRFRDYKPEELTAIFRGMVKRGEEGYTISPEADGQLLSFFQNMYNMRLKDFGNARDVRNVYSKAVSRLKQRLAEDPSAMPEITLEDIQGKEAQARRSVDDVLASLDDMVGLGNLKKDIRSIVGKAIIQRQRVERGLVDPSTEGIHIAITGNPGTGKTEVAKRLGQVFKAAGILPTDKVVVKEKKNLLDSYSNSAAKNMNEAVDESLGGILFIDEAYNLIPMDNPNEQSQDGKAAVESLMTRMVGDAGKFITIIAGYKNLIDEFITNANPGLASRFSNRIHIADYSATELEEIYMQQVSRQKMQIDDDAVELLRKAICGMVAAKDENFGNARSVIALFKDTVARQGDRLQKEFDIFNIPSEEMMRIRKADIPYEEPRAVDLEECFRELDQLVGLESVKKEIRTLADSIFTEQERARMEGRQPEIPMFHYQFLGNPGTGKTTVARIMGNIFYSLGLLPTNKLLEITPGDLIIGFVGQTAKQTRKMVKRGVGGVLFIDEAYGLHDGGYGEKDATPELLTLLNDLKGKMVAIVAGYPREMEAWKATNTGIDRRFEKKIYFEDYSADDLSAIFGNICRSKGMRMADTAEEEMHRYFDRLVRNRTANFGNAAEAVKYFNQVRINQGARLRRQGNYTRDDLYLFTFEDMKIR